MTSPAGGPERLSQPPGSAFIALGGEISELLHPGATGWTHHFISSVTLSVERNPDRSPRQVRLELGHGHNIKSFEVFVGHEPTVSTRGGLSQRRKAEPDEEELVVAFLDQCRKDIEDAQMRSEGRDREAGAIYDALTFPDE